jgi:hypothetical protein
MANLLSKGLPAVLAEGHKKLNGRLAEKDRRRLAAEGFSSVLVVGVTPDLRRWFWLDAKDQRTGRALIGWTVDYCIEPLAPSGKPLFGQLNIMDIRFDKTTNAPAAPSLPGSAPIWYAMEETLTRWAVETLTGVVFGKSSCTSGCVSLRILRAESLGTGDVAVHIQGNAPATLSPGHEVVVGVLARAPEEYQVRAFFELFATLRRRETGESVSRKVLMATGESGASIICEVNGGKLRLRPERGSPASPAATRPPERAPDFIMR